MPALVQNHKKHVVETRLQKFYSTMNQAIKLSEVENGSAKDWDRIKLVSVYDDSGKFLFNKSVNTMEWYNKYLKGHLNVLKVEKSNNFEESIAIYFPDGSLAHVSATWIFYPDVKDFKLSEKDGLIDRDRSLSGKKYFVFSFNSFNNDCKLGQFVPYGICAYQDEQGIKNEPSVGCQESVSNERALCTLLIARNGWKIPHDYPIKF